MIDQATNGDGDSGRFKILNDWEHDDPAQAPTFKRDQNLTPQALFKAKVLAVMKDEMDRNKDISDRYMALTFAMWRIEAIAP